MFEPGMVQTMVEGVRETLYMVLASTAFGYLLGLPLGILLCITGEIGIRRNPVIYRILDIVVNLIRSVPFLILLILVSPFTKWLVGKSYGATATVVSLVIAAAPFIARMVESSLNEVDQGVIEAAKSMGATDGTIIFKVLIGNAHSAHHLVHLRQSEIFGALEAQALVDVLPVFLTGDEHNGDILFTSGTKLRLHGMSSLGVKIKLTAQQTGCVGYGS